MQCAGANILLWISTFDICSLFLHFDVLTAEAHVVEIVWRIWCLLLSCRGMGLSVFVLEIDLPACAGMSALLWLRWWKWDSWLTWSMCGSWAGIACVATHSQFQTEVRLLNFTPWCLGRLVLQIWRSNFRNLKLWESDILNMLHGWALRLWTSINLQFRTLENIDDSTILKFHRAAGSENAGSRSLIFRFSDFRLSCF